MKTLAIIGGGAAGLACAIEAARSARSVIHRTNSRTDNPEAKGADSASAQHKQEDDLRVVVFEADEDRVGRSILATGNGRCNFSNTRIQVGEYHNAEFVGDALLALHCRHLARRGKTTQQTLNEDAVHEFFEDLGLFWHDKRDGRAYPNTNKASTVLDVLRKMASALGVHIECAHRAVSVECTPCEEGGARVDYPQQPFHIRFANGEIRHVDALVIASGGRGIEHISLPDAIPQEPLRPVLGALATDTHITRQLNNIRVYCRASLERKGKKVAREEGELLFRDYGVSGVAVFNLSRFARPDDVLAIDFFPHYRECDLRNVLFSVRKRMTSVRGGKAAPMTWDELCAGALLPQVARVVLAEAKLHPQKTFDKSKLDQFIATAKHFPLTVQGIHDERQCQVMRGGVSVDALDPRTCESRDIPGLFVVGEALDVDGPCGGYNLHWAWSSGLLAGSAAAERLFGDAADAWGEVRLSAWGRAWRDG